MSNNRRLNRRLFIMGLAAAMIIHAGGKAAGRVVFQNLPADRGACEGVGIEYLQPFGKRMGEVFVVDTRRPEAFQRAHIPGSLNIPLYFLKTKPFLRLRPVVLVNQGFCRQEILDACRRFAAEGMHAVLLNGGLNAWHQGGGPLIGSDPAAGGQMNRLAPETLFREPEADSRILVDVSSARSAASRRLWPGALHLPRMDRQGLQKLTDRRRKIVGQTPNRFLAAVVMNADGNGYEAIEGLPEQSGMTVFYLAGGIQDYEHFLRNRQRMLQSKESRMKTTGGCRCRGPIEPPSPP